MIAYVILGSIGVVGVLAIAALIRAFRTELARERVKRQRAAARRARELENQARHAQVARERSQRFDAVQPGGVTEAIEKLEQSARFARQPATMPPTMRTAKGTTPPPQIERPVPLTRPAGSPVSLPASHSHRARPRS